MIERVDLSPVHTRRRSGEVSQHVLVEVRAEDGLVGFGEMSDVTDLPATMPDLPDLQAVCNEAFAGLDESGLVRLSYVLDGLLSGRADPGIYTGMIRCGLEVAFYDLAARRYGVPLAVMLGGPTRKRIRTCYPLFRCQDSADVDDAIAQVDQLVVDGYRNIRLYVGADPDADEALVQRLRDDYLGHIDIQAYDLSNRLDRTGAIDVLRRLVKLWRPGYIESVAEEGDLRGMAQVRRAMELRVSEHVGTSSDIIDMWQADAVDIINVADASLGGLRASLYAFALCADLGLKTILSTTQSTTIGTAAELHLGAAVVNVDYPTVSIGPKLYQEDLASPGIEYVGDYALVPLDAPGLGVVPDPALVCAAEAPLTWQGYGIVTELPDEHATTWKYSRGVRLSGLGKQL